MNEFYENNYKQVDFGKEKIRNAVYEACTFVNCSFANLNFIELTFEDCVFTDCDFTGAFLNETAFRDVNFVGCKMIGLNFESISPFRLKMNFENTLLDYASFHKLKISGIQFINCSLKECDFSAANLKKAVFTESILTDAQFNQTNLVDADFRLSKDFTINPSINQIKGACFLKEDLSGLLAVFKIRVENH